MNILQASVNQSASATSRFKDDYGGVFRQQALVIFAANGLAVVKVIFGTHPILSLLHGVAFPVLLPAAH